MALGLSRLERISASSHIQKIRREGKPIAAYPFRVFRLKNDSGFARMTVVVSKRSGGSVLRNKVKRTVREFFRKKKSLLGAFDYLFYTAVPLKRQEGVNLKGGLESFFDKARVS